MRSDRRNKKKTDKQAAESAAMQADGTAAVRKRKKKMKTWKKVLLILVCLFLAMCIAVGVYAGIAISKAPKIDTSDIYNILTESTVIYDDSGNEIDTVFSDQNRTNVEYKDLPKNLVNAVVSLEDKTFWDHHGFNFIRILGAVKEAVFNGGQVSGTSTITQQLARNLFLKDKQYDYDMTRKNSRSVYYADS